MRRKTRWAFNIEQDKRKSTKRLDKTPGTDASTHTWTSVNEIRTRQSRRENKHYIRANAGSDATTAVYTRTECVSQRQIELRHSIQLYSISTVSIRRGIKIRHEDTKLLNPVYTIQPVVKLPFVSCIFSVLYCILYVF